MRTHIRQVSLAILWLLAVSAVVLIAHGFVTPAFAQDVRQDIDLHLDPTAPLPTPLSPVAFTPTGVAWVDEMMKLMMAIVSAVVALTISFGPIIRFFYPLVSGWMKTKELKHTIEAVGLALKPAASAAWNEEKRLLQEATRKDSDGGEVVTEAERQTAAQRGAEVGFQVLSNAGLLERALKCYGEENLKQSFHAGIAFKLDEMPAPQTQSGVTLS